MANKAAPQKGGLVSDKLTPQKMFGQKSPAPVKQASRSAASAKSENRFARFFGGFGRFFNDLRIELKKVVWPSRETSINLTILVIVVCVAVGIALGIVDLIFGELFKLLFGAA